MEGTCAHFSDQVLIENSDLQEAMDDVDSADMLEVCEGILNPYPPSDGSSTMFVLA